MRNKASNDTKVLEAEVRKAVEEGYEVQERVRQITLHMIRRRSFDIKSLQQTASAVLRGARAGVETELKEASTESKVAAEHLKQAVSGLDVALAQFAEAAKLAVEEAGSRAERYSREDLMRARKDVEKLEKMFLDALRDSTSATRDAAGDILHDLGSHMHIQGSAVGRQMQDTLEVISNQIRATGSAQAGIGLHLARNTADLLRQIAAGVLTGLADHLRPERPQEAAKVKETTHAHEPEHATEEQMAEPAHPHPKVAAHARAATHAGGGHSGHKAA